MTPRGPIKCVSIVMLVTTLVATGSGLAVGVPPPPPNPSEEDLRSGRADVRAAAERVGRLTSRVAAASEEVTRAQIRLAETYEGVTNAQRKHSTARAAAEAAEARVRQSSIEAEAAGKLIRRAREDVDAFAAASYRQQSMVGSLSAYISSDSPNDLLDRAALLNAVGRSQLNALENMRRARIEKSNLDAAARAALQEANATKRAAESAATEARSAYAAAVDAKAAAKATTEEQLSRESAVQRQLGEARRALDGLTNQRRQYEDWQQARREAQRNAARPKPSAPPAHRHASSGGAQARGVFAPTTGVITSTYGPRWGSIHYGLDIANSIGTPIVSVMSGRVISSGPASGFGLWVRVRHDNGIITVYGHINETLVWVGQRVGAGQQIATVGNRGQSTGPHLHFEVHQRGVKVDPLFWLRRNGVAI